jgi:hypothetical protein
LLAFRGSHIEDESVTPQPGIDFGVAVGGAPTTQQETDMSFGDSNVLRRASGLLVLGFLAASTGHAASADPTTARGRGEVPDNRYNHGYYYPPRGGWVHTLPRGYRPYYYRGRPYYFHNGVWYERRSGGFFIIRPPIGLQVSVPPPCYTPVWIGGVPYYYADETYYRWIPSTNAYQVVGPPSGADSPDPPPPLTSFTETSAGDSFVYPRNGQSTEQQAADRYECHTWSKGQTGFDPTQPGGNVTPNENASRSAEYQRATSACLEARGYSVK